MLRAIIAALILCWPIYARAADLVLELECHPSSLVKNAIRDGAIMPVEVGINADGDMVLLLAVKGGGYWLGLVTDNGEKVCGLSAGPSWQTIGQQS